MIEFAPLTRSPHAYASIPIIMPQLGESIAEATVVNCWSQSGDQVEADQDIIEVETNKATMNVASPCPGRVEKFAGQARTRAIPSARCWATWKPARRTPRAWAWIAPAAANASGDADTASTAGGHSDRRRRKRGVQPTVRGLPVPAHAAGRQLHVAAHEGAHGRTGPARRRPGRPRRAAAPAGGSPSRISRSSSPTWRSTSSARPPPCAWPWPMPCGAVGRGRWPPSALPVCLDPLLAHRKTCNPKPGPALYALRALALALAENSAPAGRLDRQQDRASLRPLMSASPSKRRMACWCP